MGVRPNASTDRSAQMRVGRHVGKRTGEPCAPGGRPVGYSRSGCPKDRTRCATGRSCLRRRIGVPGCRVERGSAFADAVDRRVSLASPGLRERSHSCSAFPKSGNPPYRTALRRAYAGGSRREIGSVAVAAVRLTLLAARNQPRFLHRTDTAGGRRRRPCTSCNRVVRPPRGCDAPLQPW